MTGVNIMLVFEISKEKEESLLPFLSFIQPQSIELKLILAIFKSRLAILAFEQGPLIAGLVQSALSRVQFRVNVAIGIG